MLSYCAHESNHLLTVHKKKESQTVPNSLFYELLKKEKPELVDEKERSGELARVTADRTLDLWIKRSSCEQAMGPSELSFSSLENGIHEEVIDC